MKLRRNQMKLRRNHFATTWRIKNSYVRIAKYLRGDPLFQCQERVELTRDSIL